jgi:hypothetical protein
MGLDPNEVSGLILILILTGVIVAFSVVALWQSFHCIMCNRWISWKAVKEGKYSCENEGDCNLERLAQEYK